VRDSGRLAAHACQADACEVHVQRQTMCMGVAGRDGVHVLLPLVQASKET